MVLGLEAGERVDTLPSSHPLKIIQSKNYLAYSTDALFLAKFAHLRGLAKETVVDLCTGNGVLPLCLADRYPAEIWGVEIQAPLCDMARRSVALNGFEERIHILEASITEAPEKLGHDMCDIITCNPPYFKVFPASLKNPKPAKAQARHELSMTLTDVFRVSRVLLKNRGQLFMVHRPDRLQELMVAGEAFGFGLQRLRFIHPKPGTLANMVLLAWRKNGGQHGLKVEAPAIMYDEADELNPVVRAELYE